MRMMKTMLLASVVLGAACSSTKVDRTYIDPTANASDIEDVLVVAVVRDDGIRRSMEDDLAAALRKRGIAAVPSYRALPQGAELTRDAVKEVVERDKFSHVLVTNYEGMEEELDYVPPSMGYYGYMGTAFSSPGYYRETTTLRLQTRLFSAEEGGELLWSANSRTTDPSDSEKSIEGIANELVEELYEDITI